MTDLTCARCGSLVAHVRDTRFGMLPASSVCPPCGAPAFRRHPMARGL